MPKLQTAAKNICLSSEGKGRIQLLSKKHVFSYESVNDAKVKRWSLGLNIPLHGEEVLHLTWASPVKVKGAFYRRLRANLREADNRHEYEKMLKHYILQFASLIGLLEDLTSSAPQAKCQGELVGECQLGSNKFSWAGLDSEKLTLTSLKDSRFQLVVEASSLQAEYFQRLKISLRDNEKLGPFATLLEMDLSLQACQ